MDCIDVVHHFAQGVYAKELHLPARHYAISHRHIYDHLSILAKGRARVTAGLSCKVYSAGDCVVITKGTDHRIDAIEDCVWFCVHAVDGKGLLEVDEVLIDKG